MIYYLMDCFTWGKISSPESPSYTKKGEDTDGFRWLDVGAKTKPLRIWYVEDEICFPKWKSTTTCGIDSGNDSRYIHDVLCLVGSSSKSKQRGKPRIQNIWKKWNNIYICYGYDLYDYDEISNMVVWNELSLFWTDRTSGYLRGYGLMINGYGYVLVD